jgi:Putative zinc-finger
MKFSEETLMAYADGELDAETRAAIEAAIAADPAVAHCVARHMSLVDSVRAAYDPVLQEAPPERLINAVARAATPGSGKDAGRGRGRAAKATRWAPGWSWPQWSAIAASLVLGVIAGRLSQTGVEPLPVASARDQVLASGDLAHALSAQLASEQSENAPVRIGISFRSKSGEYCRTFALANRLGGLACRHDRDWRLRVLAPIEAAAPASSAYRMAGSEMPPAVVREVQTEITGNPLDANEEKSARQRGWRE